MGLQALPPTGRIGNVRLQAGQHQRALGAGQCHIQRVQLFTFARGLLDGQHIGHTSRGFGFVGQVDKTLRVSRLARPVHQNAHGLGL